MLQMKNSLKVTWKHPRSKHWHQLDHVLANNVARQYINVVKVNPSADCFTDHRLLVCKCSFSLKRKRKGKKPPTKPSIKVTPEVLDRLHGYLNQHLTNLPQEWNDLKECLQNAAIYAFGKKKKHKSDWFDENDAEICALIKDRHGNKKEIQRRVRQMKNDWFTNKANQAEIFYIKTT